MSSLVVFSIDVGRLAAFYEIVLGATSTIESSGDIRLINDRDEILIHSIPKQVSKTIQISSPPAPRETAPFKPVFDVVSLEEALASVESSGGVVTSRSFSVEELTRHDVIDPDGNVIQLRCRTS